MQDSVAYGPLALEAASRAGLAVVIAELSPARMVYVSDSALELFGVSRAELSTRSPFSFVAPEQLPLVSERLRQRLSGTSLPPVELTIVRGDGSRIQVECRIVDLALDGVPGAAVFLATPAPRAADLAADARYRELVDAAPDGVTITRGTEFLYINQAALAVIGCKTVEEASSYSLQDLLAPDDLRVMSERTTAMLREGTRFPPRDYVVHGRGRPVTIEISSMVIDFGGAPAILAFLRDVTEARKAQAELERTQRLAALGTLVAGVAHEVNNPLSFASMGATLLERFFEGDCRDRDGGREALSNVTTGLERIGSLVQELRSFMRADEQELVTVELSGVFASAVRMTALAIHSRARLKVEIGASYAVRGSPGRLEQVFVNLLLNAAQSFSREDVAKNLVRLRAERKGKEVIVSVEDNGAGIALEDRARVFDPFFTTKPVGDGLGLGLSICHAIVTRYGGRIEVSSEVERGTTISVILPAADGDVPAELPVVESTSPPSRRRRILIVDDEPAIGRTLRTLLAPAHDVVVASGGLEAAALLNAADPTFDVVLCDITMPDLSGTDLFEQVCKLRPELERRFIFMTGGMFRDDIREPIGATGAPCLEKPFGLGELGAIIERIAG